MSNILSPAPIVEPNQTAGENNAPDPAKVIQYSPALVEQAHSRAANILGKPELELWLKSITRHPEYRRYMEWRGQEWGPGKQPTRAILLTSLIPSYQDACQRLLARVATQGYTLLPFFAFRSVYSQARLWAQAQNPANLQNEVRNIHFQGAPYIAAVLANHAEFCLTGRVATSALPGLSWHNWGMAMDCYVEEGNQTRWSAKHPGYRAYATIARDELGMNAGFFWTSKMDAVHVQGHQANSPRNSTLLDWATIDICMWSIDTAVKRNA